MPLDPLAGAPGTIPRNDPGAGTPPGGGVPAEPKTVTPGNAFIDTMLAGDVDGNGLSKKELAAEMVRLQKLAADGKGDDAAEKTLLTALIAARKTGAGPVAVSYVWDEEAGKLRLTLPSGEDDLPVRAADAQDLPAELVKSGEVTIDQGVDPGNFYCEHMFFSAQVKASEPGSSVLDNAHGEKLVGFLHLPSDALTELDPTSAEAKAVSQAERHHATRKVIAAVLSGLSSEIAQQAKSGPIRILLTGYDTFDSIKNNPTGDFVTHLENLDASMALAFGDKLKTSNGKPGPTTAPALTWVYDVLDAAGKLRKVYLSAARFPVADSAITPKGPQSVQKLMQSLLPQAVISMGVAPGGTAYRAEHRADSGGLSRTLAGGAHHDAAVAETPRLADNFALARAILDGKSALG